MGYTGKKPTNVVDVSETQSLTVDGDLTISDKIVHAGDTNTAIRFAAADTVTIETAGSERLRVTDAGNVGIGRTPVAYGSFTAFNVAGSAGAIEKIVHTGNTVELQNYASSALGAVGLSLIHI